MKTMLGSSSAAMVLFGSVGHGAVGNFHCETVKGSERTKLEVQAGQSATALDEPAARLRDHAGHKIGAFYYAKDDSLGLVIDDATNTTYRASKLAPKLLTFLSLRDGTEIKCNSVPFQGK